MATKKSFFSKPSYRFLSTERNNSINPDPMFEFDESDWNSNQTPSSDTKKFVKNSKSSKKSTKRGDSTEIVGGTATSLPVNIPDWSKILREDYRRKDDSFEDEGEVDDDEEIRVPPHEYLARQFAKTGIASSFSVHEGVGRTLKGRDLSRVRNAIWEKTGFED